MMCGAKGGGRVRFIEMENKAVLPWMGWGEEREKYRPKDTNHRKTG